jgi:hypothetical protein
LGIYIDKQLVFWTYAIIRRKKGDSVVSISREFGSGFLAAEVVPISACSFDKQMTSTNGTTSTEEILQPNSR